MTSTDPGVTILGALATYNVVQNLIIPEKAYVPANLAMTVGLITFGRRSGLSLASMGLGGNRLQDGLLLGTAVGAAVGGVALAGAAHDRSSRLLLDERARAHGRGQVAYRVFARFPLGTALFEEVAFRGVLDGIWRLRRGKRAARLATAAAFGAWHILPTYLFYPEMGAARGSSGSSGVRVVAALSGAVLTGLSGFGFTALRERSGSVAAPWLAHAVFNTVSYLAARRAWSFADGAG
jgi:membrane protease YdiL (CAAX protease family)